MWSPFLFNLYAEYIMWNARLVESQAGIKIAGRNINNLRYTLMAESEEELKNLLMRVKKESENPDLKLNIQKTRLMASDPITLWQIVGGKVEAVMKWSEVKSLGHVWLFVTPLTVAHQTPWFMGFSRQEYWSGVPFLSPGDLPNPGIEPQSPTVQTDALPSEPHGKPWKQW